MSSRIIPRDQSGAYQRWQLDSFTDVERESEPESTATMVDEQISHLNWPTAEEIEDIQQRAHDQGVQAGHQEGREAGFREGREAGFREGREAGYQEGLAAGGVEGHAAGYAQGSEKSVAELERIKQLAASLDSDLAGFESQLAEDVLNLSLAVARQLVRNALRFRPEVIVTIVRDAIASLPQPGQHPQLVMHPEDAALVRSLMEEELSHFHCRILEDSHIERGGCRVKTDSSEIDATLAGRWEKAMAALGRDDDWLV